MPQLYIHWFSVGKWNRKATVHIFFFFFFFSLNIMFADALGPPVIRSSATITIKMQTQHPFVVFDFEIVIRQTYIV